jgi:LDH2 family malate/lactate/ureidoglycolate dehydrogenase
MPSAKSGQCDYESAHWPSWRSTWANAGQISPYSYIEAEQGFASIIGSNATTTIAPSGGSDARLDNIPLGFGVPDPSGSHFMLDMAMSVLARPKIRGLVR